MSHNNQSIVIHAAGDLRVEARDVLEPGLGEILVKMQAGGICGSCLLYTSPSPRDGLLSRMPSSA